MSPAAKTRVVVVSQEAVGDRMAGPAIRALELARALADRCEVTLAAPPPSQVHDPRLTLVEAGFVQFDLLLATIAAHDVAVVQDLSPTLLGRVRKLPVRLVVDLYNPTVMEVLEAVRDKPPRIGRRIQATANLKTLGLCAAADFIVCASEKQRDMWLGAMALPGIIDLDIYARDPTLRSLIDVVPFGLPEDPPRRERGVLKGVWPGIGEDDLVLLWAGGIWNWLDGITPIRAVEQLRAAGLPVHLFFMGIGRPRLEPEEEMSATRLAVEYARERGLDGSCVHFNRDWVPYAERQDYLLEADLGLSAHHDHLEARFSFRTRILDYLWAGLPVVATRGDALADLIERDDLGSTVAPEDAAGFAAACRALLEDRERYAATAGRIEALAPSLRWSEAARPLVDWCADGWREAPRRPRRAGLITLSTTGQYLRVLPNDYLDRGLGAAIRKVARRIRRAL